MLSEKARVFLSQPRWAVLTTFRAHGAIQMSVVRCGLFRNGVAVTVHPGRAKLANLKRNPRCSILLSDQNWRPYLVLEGRAELLTPGHADPEELRMALRDAYRGATGNQEPKGTWQSWEAFDKAMHDERRSVVIVEPEHVYGSAA